MKKFHSFIARASACTSIFQNSDPIPNPRPSQSSPSPENMTSSVTNTKPRVILLEDLPNILYGPTRASFHSALQMLIESTVPVVIIVSDAGVRGGDLEGGGWWKGKEVVDIRTILGPLLKSPYVTQIAYVPLFL